MRCVDPFVKAGEAYACGRCLPCKFRLRRVWFHRVMLEASQHDYSSVVTLTYDEAAIPEDMSLKPAHLRDWLKRFRKLRSERYPWGRLRFLACGEYGESSGRPHYHAVMFGLPGCERGRSGRVWCGDCGCLTCSDVATTWTLGASSIDSLTRESAAYVSGYVTRKVLSTYSGEKLRPFMRMSNRPGLGAMAMHDVASTILQYRLAIPVGLCDGKTSRVLPFGRYLRRKLNEAATGYSGAPVENSYGAEAMQAARDFAWKSGIPQAEIFRQINEVYASQLWQREKSKTVHGL